MLEPLDERVPVVKLMKMASGDEDEVQILETGGRRTTRATRAVATRRSRGRKKTAAPPRTTRSKKNTRTTQSAESDDVEEDDDEVQEETQNTSDTEAQDQIDDQASSEAEKDDEQTQSVVNKSTEDSSTVENGVAEQNHNSDKQKSTENVENNSEKSIVPDEKKKKDTMEDDEPEIKEAKNQGKKVTEEKQGKKVTAKKQENKVTEEEQEEKVTEDKEEKKVTEEKQGKKVTEKQGKKVTEDKKEKTTEEKKEKKTEEKIEKKTEEKKEEKTEEIKEKKTEEKIEKKTEEKKEEKTEEMKEEEEEKEKKTEKKEKKVSEEQEMEVTQEQEKKMTEEEQEKKITEEKQEMEVTEERQEMKVTEEKQKMEVTEEKQETEVTEEKQEMEVTEEKQKQKVTEEEEQKITEEQQEQEEDEEVKGGGEGVKETVIGKSEEPLETDEAVEKELQEVKEEEESKIHINDKEVPELEGSPPPTINTVIPSPIRSGLKIKGDPTTPTNTEKRHVSQEVSEEKDVNQYTGLEETSVSRESGDEGASEIEKTISVKKDEVEEEPMEVEECKEESEAEVAQANESTESHPQEEDASDIKPENVEEMTVIDEVMEEGHEERNEAASERVATVETEDMEGGFRTEPDTEMVSEDELPTESSKEPLETEAVSDEELPDPAAAVDLPETEAVSEDELPPEKTDKKKKKSAKQSSSSGKKKKSRSEAQKRKLADGDTYDPSSPTSENSCDESPAAKRVAVAGASGGAQAKPVTKTRKSLPELEKYWKAVKEDPSDFTGWTYLLQYVDQENDIDAAREAYDAFLSHYPYCYGYWRKYADYEKRKGNKEKCEEVFERGLKAIPLSVDLWIHFLNYTKATYADNEEHLRIQFEKAINACGMEFRSDRLWESYIKWEIEGKRLQNVTNLYDRLLAMPTQGYTNHFDNFQEHISSNPPQKVLSVDEFLTLRREVLQLLKQYDQPAAVADDAAPGEEVDAPPGEEPEEQPVVKTDEETTALRERIIFIRRKVHKATVTAVLDRWNYEEGIKRPYFHVKPLERCQLKNWKEYLDFEIEHGDQERIIILFERCLIACALYEEFWIKFIRYLESQKEDMTERIRNVYERACTIHHTKKPNLHLHWAVFEESLKNYDKASEILTNLEKLIPNMLQVAYRRINLERRCNNMDKVCALYEHYITNTKNKVISNNMAIKYARFCWKVKGDVEKAISVLNKAVEKDRDNPRLYLQLVDMGLQQNPLNEDDIISIIDQFLNRDTDPDQKVLFAQRKVEFLEDFGSDILSVQKAHDEFQRYFKQAKDRKKKSPDMDGKSLDGSAKKGKGLSDSSQMHSSHAQSHASPQNSHSSTSQQPPQPPSGSQTPTATASTGQYQPPNYNQTGGYSQQQPPAQGGYQGGQYPPAGPQQPPAPYNQPPYNQQYGQSNDPNYANYQNWGYSQTGYGGYNQGWGNYNYY